MEELTLEDKNRLVVLEEMYGNFKRINNSFEYCSEWKSGYESGLSTIYQIITVKSLYKDFNSDLKGLIKSLDHEEFLVNNRYYKGMLDACIGFTKRYYRIL